MKRYKLLKDLPTFAKGDLFEIRGDGCLWWIGNSSFKCGWGQGHWRREVMAYHKNTLERFPNILEEWFEKIEPKSGIKDVWFPDVVEGRNNVVISFETREEAELAVCKLKAWKRLKDKGFRFERWGIGGEYGNTITFSDYIEYNDETRADLDLLFGGEK